MKSLKIIFSTFALKMMNFDLLDLLYLNLLEQV